MEWQHRLHSPERVCKAVDVENVGAKKNELLDVYEKQVRSGLVCAVSPWQPALTKGQPWQIEEFKGLNFM